MQTLIESTRCMLNQAKLPNTFWAKAISTISYLQNSLRTITLLTTPYELWNKEKPKTNHLRIFGCRLYVYVPDEKRQKLDAKTQECILIGYNDEFKWYKTLNPKFKLVFMSRNIIIDELNLLGIKHETNN